MFQNTETGTYVFPLLSRDAPSPLVAAEKDTGPLTRALLAASPGKNLAGYREKMAISQFVKLWSKVMGVKGEAVKVPLDGFPSDLKAELEDAFAYNDEFGYFGEKKDHTLVDPKDVSISSVPL